MKIPPNYSQNNLYNLLKEKKGKYSQNKKKDFL